MRDLKVRYIAAAFLAVVALGVGARRLHYELRVADPVASLASEVAGVRAVEIAPAAGGLKDVVVELDGDVRLEEVYEEVERRSAERLGSSFGRLLLRDRRTPELIDGFYRIHYALQEAMVTGRFSEMARQVDQILSEAGFEKYRIFVGERHVFVQIHSPSGGYLYEALPRAGSAARAGGEGG